MESSEQKKQKHHKKKQKQAATTKNTNNKKNNKTLLANMARSKTKHATGASKKGASPGKIGRASCRERVLLIV